MEDDNIGLKMLFLSHTQPDRLLKEHLKEVGEASYNCITGLPLSNRASLATAARLIGLSHDFGKYTSFFQGHLLQGRNFGARQHHAFISALLGAWLLQEEFPPGDMTKPEDFLPLIGYLIIHRHHGDLTAPELVIPPPRVLNDPPQFMKAEGSMREHLKALWIQKEDLLQEPRFSAVAEELQSLGIKDIGSFLTEETFITIFKFLFRLNRQISEGLASEKLRMTIAFWTMLLFSVLIDADKRGAARVSTVKRRDIPPDLVDRYIAEHFSEERTPLDPLRRQLYHEVMGSLARPLNELQGKLLTLTAPTGSGKTLTALSFALKLRRRIEREVGYLPRIIYALPFISIIEQNYSVFHDVLSGLPGFAQNEHAYLLKHHHLAEIRYQEGNEERRVEEALLLTESWESEVIVTTFVQLLHTIIGFKNSFLRKFHNIVGSILVLDEVQSIPVEQWPLARNFLKLLSEELGVTVIQMTATRPLIFKEGEAQELVPSPDVHFQKLHRTILKAKTQRKISLDSLEEKVLETWDENGSLLVVLNTIPMSIKAYEGLKAKLSDNLLPFIGYPKTAQEGEIMRSLARTKKKVPIVYLSTNISPLQRATRIDFLKAWLGQGFPAIVISTQVIEAGVDLDFQNVIRDIGPLDSIVQVAGRCNRSATKEAPGMVQVYRLEGGGAEHVYKKLHVWGTSKILGDGEYPEDTYIQEVERFFKKVHERIDADQSREIWKAFLRLDFYREDLPSVSDYRLIAEGPQVPIFTVLTDEDEIVLQQFKERVLQEKDFKKRRRAHLLWRKAFHERLITPRLERAIQNLPPKVEESRELHFIPKDQVEDFYDLETGFKWQPGEDTCIW